MGWNYLGIFFALSLLVCLCGFKKYVYAVFKWLTKLTSNHYFACGQEAAAYLYGSKLVEQDKVFLMHNAIDTKKFVFDENVTDIR